jgi:hypothetical protein
MAIGWMTVLNLVPWGEVIKNAPAVADGAKKLWDSVGKKSDAGTTVAEAATQTMDTAASPVAALQARLDRADASIAQLHEQMQASSELIKALAEQNSELIRRVEVNRVRVLWLAALVLLFGAIAALNLAVTFSR